MKSLFLRSLHCLSVALLLLCAGCGGDNKPVNPFTAEFQRLQKDPNAEAAARGLAALALQQKGKADTAGAERSVEVAAKRAGEIKDADARTTAFNTVASTQGQLDLLTDCRKFLKEVQNSIEKMSSDEARGKALARMALTFENYLKDAAQAKYFFDEAEKTAKKSTEVPAQARGLLEVARYLGYAKNAELKASAARLIGEAKTAAATIQDDRARIDALADIVITLDKSGNKAEASASLEEATKAARAIMTPASRAHALIDLAERAREIQRSAESLKLYDEALEASKKVVDPSLKAEVELRLDLSRKNAK